MMTDRWLNVVLSVVVVLGLAAVAIYERPRAAEERAELLGQDVAELDEAEESEADGPAEVSLTDVADDVTLDAAQLDEHGVSASHPEAVEVGMRVLDAGGNAVDAAIAASYTLGVVEPFGSGVGGGGAMLIHEPDGEPVAYDYREIAPDSGEAPASDIGVPGFVAGMEHAHAEHGSLDLEALIEPAVRYAEDGVEVTEYVHQRLAGAAHRLPINQLPRLFPGGEAIEPGEVVHQPDYAHVLRALQQEGADALYGGQIAEKITAEVSGLEPGDFEGYEVLEMEPAVGRFAGLDVIGVGAPTSGVTLAQHLQIAEAAGTAEAEPGSAAHIHRLAQAYRLALSDRSDHITDPSTADVPVDRLLDPAYTEERADAISDDGFVDAGTPDPETDPESDTTHLVVVDREGRMVSLTNTLGNFFGSGLRVSGVFLNDQLRNFASDPDSVNAPEPGKRPRTFIAPAIVADDGEPVLGIGSPGGRRIPMMVAQVVERWAAHDQALDDATAAPRVHLEGRELFVEDDPAGDLVQTLADRGYEVQREAPTPEFYGSIQALRIDHDAGTVTGVADDRREGAWTSRDG